MSREHRVIDVIQLYINAYIEAKYQTGKATMS